MGFPVKRLAFQITLLIALIWGASHFCVAQERIPQFKDYPVRSIYRGRNAPLVLNRETRTFRTRLREALKEKPNFAGHYIVTSWGCGTGCQVGAIIDARTGRVYWFPFGVGQNYETDDDYRPIEFRLNSKLIIFSGYRVDRDEEPGARFYKFENGRFIFLKFIKRETQGGP